MQVTVSITNPKSGPELTTSSASWSDWGVALLLNGTLHTPGAPTVRSDKQADILAGGHLSFVIAEQGVLWDLEIQPIAGGLLVSSQIHNRGDEAVALGEVFPIHSMRIELGGAGDEICLLPYQSWTEQRVYGLQDPELPTRAKIKTQSWNRTRRTALQAAFLTFEDVGTETKIYHPESADYRYSIKRNGVPIGEKVYLGGQTAIPLPDLKIYEPVRNVHGYRSDQWEITIDLRRTGMNNWSEPVKVYLNESDDSGGYNLVGVRR